MQQQHIHIIQQQAAVGFFVENLVCELEFIILF